MNEKLLQLVQKPIDIINKILDNLGSPKNVIIYAIGACLAYDLVTAGELGAVNYGIAKSQEILTLVSSELKKNGTVIAVLAVVYLLFKRDK